MLLPSHRAGRQTWLKRHLRFRRHDWANILFTDEYRREGERCRHLRYATSNVWWRQYYGVGRHNGTWQDTISCCRRTSDRNTLQGWNCSAICYSKLNATTSHSSRTTLDHMLRVFYVTTWYSRMLMCYRGQLFHPIFHLLNSSGMKWNDRYVICKISQLCLEQYPQAFLSTLIRSMRRRYQTCINANDEHTRYWLC